MACSFCYCSVSHPYFRSSTIDFDQILRVPILLTTAALVLIFGQDHPAGKWSERHNLPATAIAIRQGHHVHYDHAEQVHDNKDAADKMEKGKAGDTQAIHSVNDDGFSPEENVTSVVDVAVNESLTGKAAVKILTNRLTWLPALAYLTTFG